MLLQEWAGEFYVHAVLLVLRAVGAFMNSFFFVIDSNETRRKKKSKFYVSCTCIIT